MGIRSKFFFEGFAIFMSNLPSEHDAITKLWSRQSHAKFHINLKNVIGFEKQNLFVLLIFQGFVFPWRPFSEKESFHIATPKVILGFQQCIVCLHSLQQRSVMLATLIACAKKEPYSSDFCYSCWCQE